MPDVSAHTLAVACPWCRAQPSQPCTHTTDTTGPQPLTASSTASCDEEPCSREQVVNALTPAESMVLTIVRAQVERGDRDNMTAMLVWTIDRLAAQLDDIARHGTSDG